MANLSNINGKFVVEQTTGYVGVGTTDPAYLLHMSSADTTNGTRLIIENTNASGKEYGLIADNTGVFSLRDLTAGADRLTIDSSGNVGIGIIPNNGYKLDVFDATEALFRIRTSNATGNGGVYIGNGDRNWAMLVRNSQGESFEIRDETGNATRMRIDSSGRVGIAITPSAWSVDALQVGQASVSQDVNSVYIGANTYNSSAGWKRINAQLAGYMRMGTNDGIWSFSNGVTGTADSVITWNERMRIDSDGNVGIGVTDPDAKLEIKATASTTGLTFKTTDAAGNENFFIQDGGRTGVRYYPLTVGQASGTSAASGARFQVATTAGDFVVLGTGNVGIGHITPQFGLTMAQGSGDGNRIGWEDGSNYKRASIICSSSTDALQFHTGTSDTERMRITSAGVVEIKNTGAAHLILNGDTNNSGDAGEEDSIIDFRGDGNPGLYGYRINTENWSGQTALNFQEYINGSYTSRLFISKDGNVGIGTVSPNRKLTIFDGAGGNYLVSAKWYKGAANFSNPFIVIVSNFTNTSSYPQIIIKINLIGHGISANRAQFTESICTYDLTNGDLQQTNISHKTVGTNAVAAGVFSVSGTSIGFTPLRQTNYDQFKIEADIQSYSATFDY